ncbi:hypothetical protein BD626DRAFT_474090 [Schizophyllum amplum]|uniref:C2H2-type domain-containing protein n=1 Tax=Schizophyllum amplum TaxID=97359 RepID=A0A550CXC4_9AGAR|nr:hypothetical protein BD626DRAFT_474090 [Auriculariopsis ampla]
MSARRQYTRTDQYASWGDAQYQTSPTNYPSPAYQHPQQSMPAYDTPGSQMYATDPYYAERNAYGASAPPIQQPAPRMVYPAIDPATMAAMSPSQPCARYQSPSARSYPSSTSSGGYAAAPGYASPSSDAYASPATPHRASAHPNAIPIPMRRPSYDPAYGRSPASDVSYLSSPMHHRSGMRAPSGMAAAHDEYALDYPDEYTHMDARESSPFGPSQARPYACDICQLAGEKPFLCNGGCGKTFTRKDALKRHQVRRARHPALALLTSPRLARQGMRKDR